MMLSVLFLLGALTSADAVAILLNSRSATGARTYAAAQELVMREAKAGKPLQQFVVGTMTDDKELAERYLKASRDKIVKMAEERDNALAWYLLSMEKNDIALLQKAADRGNVQALNALGIALQSAILNQKCTTNEIERALGKSYDCFRRAAAQRDPNGFINLGACYSRGLGCKQDLAIAFACYQSAAEAGHPEGMDNMSACYQFGHGVEKDSERCLYWAMRGRAARGDEAAMKWLRDRK